MSCRFGMTGFILDGLLKINMVMMTKKELNAIPMAMNVKISVRVIM